MKNTAHVWIEIGSVANSWTACKNCSAIKRRDGKNEPCKGKVVMNEKAMPEIYDFSKGVRGKYIKRLKEK